MNFFDPEREIPFLYRCFDLARLGAGKVSPNPMVGAVLAHGGRIIGEGFHGQHGGPHAEVEAVRSVRPEDRHLIAQSTLYVSLEPCCIFGRTPPCTNLILDMGIPRVVVSNLDQTPGVNGMGIRQLREAGVEVHTGICEQEGAPFSDIRNVFAGLGQPYVLLKFAQSADGYIGQEGKSVWLTGEPSKRLVHKWRSETDAILVGTQTLRVDNPALTNRLYFGKSPIRLVMDPGGDLPSALRVFDQTAPTWVFTEKPEKYTGKKGADQVVKAPFNQEFLPFLKNFLVKANVTSLLVEGGAHLLNQFLDAGWWNEARVLTAPIYLSDGIAAPKIRLKPQAAFRVDDRDLLEIYRNPSGGDR